MGCDIHSNWQLKNNNDDWETVEELDCWRNYTLFAILANVRNNGFVIPISEPRGLPKDLYCVFKEPEDYIGFGNYCCCNKISDSYQKERSYVDHSYSWLLSSEIIDYFNTTNFILKIGIVSR